MSRNCAKSQQVCVAPVDSAVAETRLRLVMSVLSTPLVSKRSSNLLTGSPPPAPSLCNGCEEVQGYVFTQCVTGGGEDRVVWRAYTGVIHCVFDQIPNLQSICYLVHGMDKQTVHLVQH
jgi:hypothetical protein